VSKLLSVEFGMKQGGKFVVPGINGFTDFREFANKINYRADSIVFSDMVIVPSEIAYIKELKEGGES